MTPSEFKSIVPAYAAKGHPEKIKLLGWYIHVHQKKDSFRSGDLKSCYDILNDTAPASFSGYLKSLVDQRLFIKNGTGYRLSGDLREQLAKIYVPTGYKVQVADMLKALLDRIPDLAEQSYLDETLICYENGAFRATVVMGWNLAYHHLCSHVLKHRLNKFNTRWLLKLPGQHKNGIRSIKNLDDFMEELKEAEVIAICKDAGIITKDMWKIMEEKLGKRNSAAHASSITIGQIQTDAFLVDLVENVVLKVV